MLEFAGHGHRQPLRYRSEITTYELLGNIFYKFSMGK
jgi:hypothetical protein